jgi:hypothetical protein
MRRCGLALAQHEIANAAFFSVDRLFDVMPARLARGVTYAARRHANVYLEHGLEPDQIIIIASTS